MESCKLDERDASESRESGQTTIVSGVAPGQHDVAMALPKVNWSQQASFIITERITMIKTMMSVRGVGDSSKENTYDRSRAHLKKMASQGGTPSVLPTESQMMTTPPRISRFRKNQTLDNGHGRDNVIATTKYKWYTWLPLSLFGQLRRLDNIYFVIISVLMIVGTYAPHVFQSPLSPWPVVGSLTVIMMGLSLVEGFEDLHRNAMDQKDNNRMVTVLRVNEVGKVVEEDTRARDIQSGDVVKIPGNSPVPVDLMVVATSEHEDGHKCLVETSNIDGETNLKVRSAPGEILPLINEFPKPAFFEGTIEFEVPNADIHNFSGALHIHALDKSVALATKNIMLRGSYLSNPAWVVGVAVYTGQETKVAMNTRDAPKKFGIIDRNINRAVVVIFGVQLLLITICIIGLYAAGYNNKSDFPYIYVGGDNGVKSELPLWLEQFFVFFLLFSNVIPISLHVTLVLVQVAQSYLLGNDVDMYDDEHKSGALVKSSNLLQEFGNVTNIFSDKTGTLTKNEMRLVYFNVDGTHFRAGAGGRPEDIKLAHRSKKVQDMLVCVSTCHSILRDSAGRLQAESPDELALLEGTEVFGCKMAEKRTKSVRLEWKMNSDPSKKAEVLDYQVLAVNVFDATRKCMSVLIKEPGASGRLILMCKGADTSILPVCKMTAKDRKLVDREVVKFATQSLRTLCLAQRVVTQQQADAWLVKFELANSTVGTDARDEALSAVASEIEVDLEHLAVTAIEDELQDEAPEVIADLLRAGIVVWMLTGDKEETAVQIGYSSSLIPLHATVCFITKVASLEGFEKELDRILAELGLDHERPDGPPLVTPATVVIDGLSFRFMNMENSETRAKLLCIFRACKSIIACRLTPAQKQAVVRLVKEDPLRGEASGGSGGATLGIGDGANDVSMLREADVGVGILGKEGRQAANNADVAIGRFRFLRKLLLVHGRHNYLRSAKVFLYSIHKNMVITLTLVWFSFLTALSGTSPYESALYSLFNFALGWPIVMLGVFDRDLSDDFMVLNPATYSTGRRNTQLGIGMIAAWLSNSIAYAVIICLICYVVLASSIIDWGLFEVGLFVYNGLLLTLQVKVMFMYHQWQYVIVFFLALSIFGSWGVFYLLSNWDDLENGDNPLPAESTGLYKVTDWLGETPLYWLFSMFTIPFITWLMEMAFFGTRFFFKPTEEMAMRRAEHRATFDREEKVFDAMRGFLGIGVLPPSPTNTSVVLPMQDLTAVKTES